MEELVYELHTAQAQAFFEYAGFRARNMGEPLRRAGRRLLHHINLTFATEGEWAAEFWPKLSEPYATRKREAVGERPMLVFEGTLRSRAISRRAIRVTQHADGGELSYELDTPVYAPAHQYGGWWDDGNPKTGREPSQHPPARPFVGITDELVQLIEEDFRVWLNEIKGVNVRRRSLDLPMPI